MPNPPSTWARRAVLALHGAILVLLPALGGMLGGLVALPLLLPLRGLWQGRAYTFAWASLLLVFYAGAFVMEMASHPARAGPALVLAVLASLEFCALLLFVRLRRVEARR